MQKDILIHTLGRNYVHISLLQFLSSASSPSSSLQSLWYKFSICFILCSLGNLSLCHLIYFFPNSLNMFNLKVYIHSFKSSSNFEEETKLFTVITTPLFYSLLWQCLLCHIKYPSISILLHNHVFCQSCFLIQEDRQAANWQELRWLNQAMYFGTL